MLDFEYAKELMKKYGIDCWLVHDFRGNNPVMSQLLGEKKNNTRRTFLFIPADDENSFLAHTLDRDLFDRHGCEVRTYSGWREMEVELQFLLKPCKKIAMEYSQNGLLPMISWVDAGTIELVRQFGVEIVSSADLFQSAAAVWNEKQFQSHISACEEISEIKDEAFKMIRNTVTAGGKISEFKIKNLIQERIVKAGMFNADGPTVAVNGNSGNPHYEPTSDNHADIGRDCVVLIDLWARFSGDSGIFSDITWVGFTGENPPRKLMEVFDTVKTARDLVVSRLKQAWDKKEILKGYQLDDAARSYIESKGYGNRFFHRTGHSLGGGDHPHGLGANLDNFETRDTRSIIPGTGFTVEPGIYLAEFGVRSEIDVYMDPVLGPTVTTPPQKEIVRLA